MSTFLLHPNIGNRLRIFPLQVIYSQSWEQYGNISQVIPYIGELLGHVNPNIGELLGRVNPNIRELLRQEKSIKGLLLDKSL